MDRILKADQLKCLFRMWGHSREEDADGVTVYRPQGFNFPLSRGRDWLEFRPDGTAIFLGAGPDDRGSAVSGVWSSVGDKLLDVSKNAEPTSRRLTIVECSDSVLKIRDE
jgi:hypothetical protein